MIDTMISKIKSGAVLPVLTAALAVALVISMLVPKEVIDTYKINVLEEEGDGEYILPLKQQETLSYSMNTGSRPMRGIHIAVSKNGGAFTEGILKCSVSVEGRKEPVSVTEHLLSRGDNLQYVYLPFDHYEQCIGDIVIRFSYVAEGNTESEYPGILVNGSRVPNTETVFQGKPITGSLKSMYVYTHDTYPLVYDLRILALLFLAASMAGKKEAGNER